MGLSSDLISQFVKVTKDETKTSSESTVYGTVVKYEKSTSNSDERVIYVHLDGTDEDLLTPVIPTSADTVVGERVAVLIKNHTATITGNLDSPAARNKDVENKANTDDVIEANRVITNSLDAEIARIDTLVSDNVVIKKTLTAANADISNLKVNKLDANTASITYATIDNLEAAKGDIDDLKANKLDANIAKITYATIDSLDAIRGTVNNLNATYATIKSLDATNARIDNLGATYATITDLNAAKATISALDGDIADINTLIFGSATGNTIQTSFANAVIAQLGNAQIKSAMIENISAGKITSGDIVTNNVRVKSADGSLLISDETMQISDGSRVRVQIGKDASGDYSINIWDQNGVLMFSKGGITDSAIKDAIIRNDMVSDTANIAAHKLDIDSLFEEINGSTNTIKSTKVYLDDKKQTLDIAFKSISDTVTSQGSTISSQGTAISAIQGQISSKIWQQDITTAKNALEEQTETLSTKQSSLEQNLNSFKSTVSSTYATKTELSTTDEKLDDAKLGNLVQNGYGEYLDNTNFGGVFTRGDCPEGSYGYFNNGTTSLIPFDPFKVYDYRYYCRLHDGKSGSNYFSIIPIDVDGLLIDSPMTLTFNQNLFYLSADLKNGDTVVHFNDLTEWDDTESLQYYRRSFLVFGYTDSTGYTYPDGTYSRKAYLDVYASGSSVDKTNNTITLSKPWSGGVVSAGTCIGQTSLGNSYCYFGQQAAVTNTEWKEWSGTIDASSYEHKSDLARLKYAKHIKVFLYNDVADYAGIYIAEQTIDKTARSSVEALDDRLSSAETSITQNTTDIALRATKAEVENTYAKISSVDAIVTRVTIAEADIKLNAEAINLRATKTEVANTLKNYSTIAEMNSAIDVKADSITNAVSSTYATKSALNTTNSNVTALGTRMTNAETSITQISNKITANVTETTNLGTRISTVEQTATGLTTRLDNQTIGGTNILRGTNTVTTLGSSASWANSTWRSAGGGTGSRSIINISDAPNGDIKKGIQIVGDDTDTTTAQDNIPVTEGATYTISCYAKGTGSMQLQVGKSPYSAIIHTLNNVTKWTKYSITFVAGDGNGVTDGKTNVYFGNRGTGTLQMCGFKMELGTVATDWTPSPYDMTSGIESASKTATNYMSLSSSGLVVGDMTKSTLGNNVLIDTDSVDIRNGNTTLASFGSNYLYLAKNSRNATIDMCNGLATMYHASKYSYDSLFVIDTAVVEMIGASTPLCLTSTSSLENVSIQFANSSKVLGGIGIIGSWLRRYGSNMYDTYTILDSGNFHDVMDGGWVHCTYGDGFTRYSNSQANIQVRKIGKQVYLRGEAKPTTAVTPESETSTVLAVIPEGYRPSYRQNFVMQGSSAYRWLMSVYPGGNICISRYTNDTTMNKSISAGAWLCCYAQWTID